MRSPRRRHARPTPWPHQAPARGLRRRGAAGVHALRRGDARLRVLHEDRSHDDGRGPRHRAGPRVRPACRRLRRDEGQAGGDDPDHLARDPARQDAGCPRGAGASPRAPRHRRARGDPPRSQDEGRAPCREPLRDHGARRPPGTQRRSGTLARSRRRRRRAQRVRHAAVRARGGQRGARRGVAHGQGARPPRSAHAETAVVVAAIRGLQRRPRRPGGGRDLDDTARRGFC